MMYGHGATLYSHSGILWNAMKMMPYNKHARKQNVIYFQYDEYGNQHLAEKDNSLIFYHRYSVHHELLIKLL